MLLIVYLTGFTTSKVNHPSRNLYGICAEFFLIELWRKGDVQSGRLEHRAWPPSELYHRYKSSKFITRTLHLRLLPSRQLSQTFLSFIIELLDAHFLIVVECCSCDTACLFMSFTLLPVMYIKVKCVIPFTDFIP